MLVKDYPERFWIRQESQEKIEVLHKTEHSKSVTCCPNLIFLSQKHSFVFDTSNFHESQKLSTFWYEIKGLKISGGQSCTSFILKPQLESQIFNKLLS